MPQDLQKKRLFILDGYGQIFRSYYAFMSNPLIDKNGNNVSAVYGFFNTVMSLLKQHKPDYFAVALDSKGKTFRHEMYPEYKANRAKAPEDLHAQVEVIKDIMNAIHMPNFGQVGMEADDIIATVAKDASELGLETVMITADKDLMQLVDDNVFALRPPRKGEHEYRLCKSKEVEEIFGVRPDQIVDYLTILGDSSDNVPGIDGLGEKSAVKLLQEWGTLDNIYANIDKMSPRVKTKLENSRDKIGLSHTLIVLKNDIFDSLDLESLSCSSIDWTEAAQQFNLIGSAKLVSSAKNMLSKGAVVHIDNVKQIVSQEAIIVDAIELDADNPQKLIGFDLKEKLKELKKQGIEGKPYFDLGIAAWLIDSSSGRYSKNDLCEKYLGNPDADQKEAVSKLYQILSDLLDKHGLRELFDTMEMPLVSVLSEMEDNGIMIDKKRLEETGKELDDKCSEIEQDIFTLCGHEFNLNSPKQLQEVLFVERNLPTGKKTATGFSTNSDVLESLAEETDDPVPELLLRYRALSKLSSVYTQNLIDLADEESRIHTTFLQTGTATGRLSSKNPNLQNIPIRTDEGRKIREAFVARPGYTLLSADYSQIELCVLADLSKDPELTSSFINGDDVHRQTAALIFGIFPELVTPAQRRIAKTINFGVIYGMSAFRLAHDLKIPRKEAAGFIDTYFDRYRGVTSFIEEVQAEAEKNSFVRTAMGHLRAVAEINSVNKNIRAAGERVAVNTVIQGTAAEIVKKAMIDIYGALKERKLKSKLLLQVHDEVILEVADDELEEVKSLIKEKMENAVKLSIPLRAGIENAPAWGQMH